MKARALVLLAVIACGDETPNPVTPVTSAKPPASAVAKPPPKEDASLTPRTVFFSNPDRTRVRISPDGKRLAFLANENNVLNVFVGPASDPTKAKAVTHEPKRNLRLYEWSMDSKYVLWFQDKDGDENWRLHAVDLDDGAGPRARRGRRHPGRARLHEPEATRRGRHRHQRSRQALPRSLRASISKTGKKTLLQKNEGFERFVVDDDFKIRFGLKPREDGGVDVQQPGPKEWTTFTTIPMEDHVTTELVDFDKTGQTLYMLDSRGRNTAALVTVDLKTKKSNVVLDDGAADIETLLVHPTNKTLQAAEAQYDRTRWHIVDRALQPDFDYLRSVGDGDIGITSRSLDDKHWIVAYGTEGATKYYRFDRDKPERKADFLFVSHDALAKLTLAKMVPVTIKSRDGLDLRAT